MYARKYHVQYENALIYFQNQPFSKKKMPLPSKKIQSHTKHTNYQQNTK